MSLFEFIGDIRTQCAMGGMIGSFLGMELAMFRVRWRIRKAEARAHLDGVAKGEEGKS